MDESVQHCEFDTVGRPPRKSARSFLLTARIAAAPEISRVKVRVQEVPHALVNDREDREGPPLRS